MARLDDLMPELKDNFSQSEKIKTLSITHTGKKRRAWLEDDKSENLKGSIDYIHKPLLSFTDLRSNPLRIFRYLFEMAKKASDDYTTPRIKMGDMMLHFDMSKDSARTALRFLLKQKFIERIAFQAGATGWSRYQLNKAICNEVERGLSTGFIDPFSDSKKKEINHSLDDVNDTWDEIDFSALEFIGFNKKC